MKIRLLFSYLTVEFILFFSHTSARGESSTQPLIISSGWRLQDGTKATESGKEISSLGFQLDGRYAGTVPGTVLTSLVNDGVYPEPLYGQNNRPDKIPDSLCRTKYWYRTVFTVPKDYADKKIWLNFEGINYAAEVWVNGKDVGGIKGAFTRGIFDITSVVMPGGKAALAVLISPQPHPGTPHEHTPANGMGSNGGITAIDGPTFLCAMEWDWIPAIRDRDSGIWQKSGGRDKAVAKEFLGIVPNNDGKILIKFQSGSADKPEINAIEILN